MAAGEAAAAAAAAGGGGRSMKERMRNGAFFDMEAEMSDDEGRVEDGDSDVEGEGDDGVLVSCLLRHGLSCMQRPSSAASCPVSARPSLLCLQHPCCAAPCSHSRGCPALPHPPAMPCMTVYAVRAPAVRQAHNSPHAPARQPLLCLPA